jgi:hypothetical protein
MNKYLLSFLIVMLPFLGLAVNPSSFFLYNSLDDQTINQSLKSDVVKGMDLAIKEHNFIKKNNKIDFTTNPKITNLEDIISAQEDKEKLPIAFLGVDYISKRIVEDYLAGDNINLFGVFSYPKPRPKRYKNIFSLSFNYSMEVESWAKYFAVQHGAKNIVIFCDEKECDGRYLEKVEQILKKVNITVIAKITPSSNIMAIKTAVMKFKQLNVDLFLVTGAYNKSEKFISTAKNLGLDLPFMFLCNETKYITYNSNNAKALTNSQYLVPSPYDSGLEIVKEYNNAIRLYDPKHKVSFGSFNGYVITRSALYIVEQIEGDVTAENFAKTARAIGKFKLGDISVRINEKRSKQVELFLKMLDKEE